MGCSGTPAEALFNVTRQCIDIARTVALVASRGGVRKIQMWAHRLLFICKEYIINKGGGTDHTTKNPMVGIGGSGQGDLMVTKYVNLGRSRAFMFVPVKSLQRVLAFHCLAVDGGHR
jgi:hypothetical protein